MCAGLTLLLLWQVARMRTVAPVTDLVAYWSAARVLLDGGNPYSSAQLLQTEVTAGVEGARDILVRNPAVDARVLRATGRI